MSDKSKTKINLEIDTELYNVFKRKFVTKELTLHGIRARTSKLLEQSMREDLNL